MFYEEARELLISLEEGLMELERRQGDRAHLDKTFRAAHSLKGAAAMVGLPAIAEFTHGIEAVLDRIRSGTLAVDADITTTLLEARDHLAAMVEADAADAPIPAPAELNQRLAELLREGRTPRRGPPKPSADEGPGAEGRPSAPPSVEPGPAPEQPPAPQARPRARKSDDGAPAPKRKPRASRSRKKKPSEQPAAHPSPLGGHGKPVYRIKLTPGPDTLRRGINPLGILDELRELGSMRVTTDPSAVPVLDDLDPERCYLSWEIDLETESARARLDDVFLFMAEGSTVSIDLLEGAPPPKPAPVVTKPAAAPPVAATAPAVPRYMKIETDAPFAFPTPTPTPTPTAASPSILPIHGPAIKGAPAAPSPRVAPRIRVDANQLDDLVGLAGELAVLSDNLQGLREVAGAFHWVHTLEALERVSRQVRDTTLDLRMVPVDELFSRFPRVVRDLADRFGKEIDLRIAGQETRLDRTIVEKLSDPMIHLIRNAVDHGLEMPDERVAQGKPRKAKISLAAGHEGDRVSIRVEDDGRGLDREAIVRRGIKNGLVAVGTSPDDPRVDNLIFEPGFTTKDKVNELSGRGVGLDVVRDAVRALRGSLAVESTPGRGTAFIFRLPLTLALIDGLLVETAGARYVVPLAQVEECVALDGSKPALSKGRPCVAVRGELIPMVPLRKLFHSPGEPPPRQELLLTRHAGQRVGVAVDRLLGRVQAVIQSLGEGLTGLNRFSGATILGDGSVSLILDLAALVTESRAADTHTHYHATPSTGARAEGF